MPLLRRAACRVALSAAQFSMSFSLGFWDTCVQTSVQKLSGVEVLWIFVGSPFTTLIPFRWTCAEDLETCRRCGDLREIDTLRDHRR